MQGPSETTPPDQDDALAPVDGVTAGSAEEIKGLPGAIGVAEFRAQWIAPLPPPAVLREYEDIHPGVAEQLFNLHEKQANHRMEMERQTQATDREAQARGQWTSFILVLAALIVAGVVGVWGRGIASYLAAGLVTLPIAGLPVVHITVRRWGEKRKLRSMLDPAAASSAED